MFEQLSFYDFLRVYICLWNCTHLFNLVSIYECTYAWCLNLKDQSVSQNLFEINKMLRQLQSATTSVPTNPRFSKTRTKQKL